MSLRHACRDKFARAIDLSGQILQPVDNSATHWFERLEFSSGMFYCAWEALLFSNLPWQISRQLLVFARAKAPNQCVACAVTALSSLLGVKLILRSIKPHKSHCNSQRPKTVCTEDDDSATAAHETHWLRAFVRANLSNWRFFARANLFSTRKAKPLMRSSWTV
jgi:hypothetical protein